MSVLFVPCLITFSFLFQIYSGKSVGVDWGLQRFYHFYSQIFGRNRRIWVAWAFRQSIFIYFSFLRSHNLTTWWWITWAWDVDISGKKGIKWTKHVCCALHPLRFYIQRKFEECHLFSMRNGKQQCCDRLAATPKRTDGHTQSKQRNGEHLLADTTGYDENRSCRVFFFCFASYQFVWNINIQFAGISAKQLKEKQTKLRNENIHMELL